MQILEQISIILLAFGLYTTSRFVYFAWILVYFIQNIIILLTLFTTMIVKAWTFLRFA